MAPMRLVVVTLLALGAGGCNQVKAPPRAPLLVKAQPAKWEDYVATLELTGEIAARTQSDLSFRVSGRVVERSADVGQHVEAGALLAKVDPAEPQADLDAANAAVVSAEALVKQASAAFDRQKSLFDSGFATKSAFDSAQQNLRTAQSSLEQARAQAASAKDALSYTELRADQSGVITSRNIEVGQVAQAAQAAFTLALDGPRDAVFNVYESIFFLEPASNEIQLKLVANPGITAVGHVREVAPAVDPKTGTVRAKVGIDDGKAPLPLGASVIGKAYFRPRQVFKLPWSATTTKEGKLAVWIVDAKSKAVFERVVEAEAFENESLVIRSGLEPGDLVVTEGGKFLFPGQVVAIEGAGP